MKRVRLGEVVRVLPRHAHHLTRETVADSQRWRILEAMIEVAASVGYAEASVASVVARAGVSRKAFYEHFADKEACFLAAYAVLSERVLADVARTGSELPDGERRAAQIERFIAALAADLRIARVFMVDVLAAGPKALAQRERVNRAFGDVIFGEASDPVRRAAIVGGVNAVVVGELLASRRAGLDALASSLAAFVNAALASPPGTPRSPRRARARSR